MRSAAEGRPALPVSALARHAETAAGLLRAMANPHRLQILCALGEGEMSVGGLNGLIPLSQSALSQHLAVLRQDRLVATRRESQTIYYRIQAGPALDVIRVLHGHFCRGGRRRRTQGQSRG